MISAIIYSSLINLFWMILGLNSEVNGFISNINFASIPYMGFIITLSDTSFQSKWEAIAKEGQDVQVYSAISELSLDIILRCAFSYQSGCQEKQ